MNAPSANSQVIMAQIDAMPAELRALVYEYGFKIVSAMRDEGYDAEAIRESLEIWRHRRQEEWLATDYIAKSRLRSDFEKIIGKR